MTPLTSLDIAELRDPVEEYVGILVQRHHFDTDRADALIDASRRLRKLGMSRASTCSSLWKVARELSHQRSPS